MGPATKIHTSYGSHPLEASQIPFMANSISELSWVTYDQHLSTSMPGSSISIGVAERPARVNRPLGQRTLFSSNSLMMVPSKVMLKAIASDDVRSTGKELPVQAQAESLLRPRRRGSISMTLLTKPTTNGRVLLVGIEVQLCVFVTPSAGQGRASARRSIRYCLCSSYMPSSKLHGKNLAQARARAPSPCKRPSLGASHHVLVLLNLYISTDAAVIL